MEENFFETLSLKIRKGFMVNRVKTFLIVAILVVAFVTLNLWLNKIDLPKFDITENQLFSLSEASQKEMKNVEQDVKIFVYGFSSKDSVVDLLKQYNKSNSKITYEMLTEESNAEKVKKYNLESGNKALIFEVGDIFKIVYDSEFVSYDYTTWQQIDLTENAITNAILNLTIAEKPKLYILTGHDELSIDQYLTKILTYLQNEIFEYTTLNLLTAGNIPEDCDLIAVFSPQKDLLDQETNVILDYINKGGNIIFTSDFVSEEASNMPNWQKILDVYGLTVENGLIYETDTNSLVKLADNTGTTTSPLIFLPKIQESSITSEIASDGAIILEMPKRILTANEEKQNELKVTYEELLKSSDKSFFLTDFSNDAVASVYDQEPSSSIISLKAIKELTTENSDESKTSEIIVISNGTFITNLESVAVGGYSQVNLYNNADFFINSVANLTNREDTITVRKELNSSTFAPQTAKENTIVLLIIFIVPILIIIIGIIVWNYRKHKR